MEIQCSEQTLVAHCEYIELRSLQALRAIHPLRNASGGREGALICYAIV